MIIDIDVCAAIVPPGLDKPDMVLTQKATLERTSEWAEKAAAALISGNQSHSVHRASASDSSKDTASHRSSKQTTESRQSPLSSPSGMNPRDIPLELRGGTARDPRDPPPRDPRDRSPRGERDDREPGEIPEDRLARTEQRRESRDPDTSSRQPPARPEDRLEHKPSIKAEKDQEIDRSTPKKDSDFTDRDVDLEFDTWASSKSLERKKSDSRMKLSPRSQSPSSKQPPVSKKPSSGHLSSERGPDDDAEPGVYVLAFSHNVASFREKTRKTVSSFVFLPCDAVCTVSVIVILSVRPSIHLSVCLSHSWPVSTRFDLRSWFLHHRVAPSF